MIAFDVNGTLSDLAPLADRLVDVGAPAHLLPTWFAGVLRDGIGLTAAGAYAEFSAVATGVLTTLLAPMQGLACEPGRAAAQVVEGFETLGVHPDVAAGVRALADAGFRLITLTNGSVADTKGLLERSGLLDPFTACLSVAEVRRWKPAPEPYLHAAAACQVAPEAVMLVAVHPWDVDGAKRAGLQACWLDREGSRYPSHLIAPDRTTGGLTALLESLPG